MVAPWLESYLEEDIAESYHTRILERLKKTRGKRAIVSAQADLLFQPCLWLVAPHVASAQVRSTDVDWSMTLCNLKDKSFHLPFLQVSISRAPMATRSGTRHGAMRGSVALTQIHDTS